MTGLLPEDTRRIEPASMDVLRSMIGGCLSVFQIGPRITNSHALWEMRPAARGLLVSVHRFDKTGRADTGADTLSIWLRPEMLPEFEIYAIQKLHASLVEPFSIVERGRVPGSTLELDQQYELKTEFRSAFRVTRIDIFSVPEKVYYADSDGDIGLHEFDSRIEITGRDGERQHTLGIDVNCSDNLALFPIAYDSSKEIIRPPGVMKPRMTIH